MPTTMTKPKFDVDGILDRIRRELSAANTAQQVLDAGKALPDLIGEIETAMGEIDDDIASEAESIDRSRATELRADKDKFSTLLTDAEFLARRINERHKSALKNETDGAMNARRASAMAKQAEAYALVREMEAPMQAVVAGAVRYQRLQDEIRDLNNELRHADYHELCAPPLWRGIAQPGDEFGHIFGFLKRAGDTHDGAVAFFKAIDRLKAAATQKGR